MPIADYPRAGRKMANGHTAYGAGKQGWYYQNPDGSWYVLLLTGPKVRVAQPSDEQLREWQEEHDRREAEATQQVNRALLEEYHQTQAALDRMAAELRRRGVDPDADR